MPEGFPLEIATRDMDIKIPTRLPWSPLILFWVAYALVGWKLSPNHIAWYIGVFMAVAALVLTISSNPWLGGVLGYTPQIIFTVLVTSILVTLIVSFSILSTLILVPLITTFLAWQELRSLNLRRSQILWVLGGIALLGLGVGEFVDLLVLPSSRY
jgi:hypothetical protein